MKTLRPTFRSANELRLADPDAFNNTVTIKVAVQPKKAGSQTVYNVNSSVNLQRNVTLPLPEQCADSCMVADQERLALRFSVSGSTKSKLAVQELILDFRAVLDKAEADLISGFLPPNSVDFIIGNETVAE